MAKKQFTVIKEGDVYTNEGVYHIRKDSTQSELSKFHSKFANHKDYPGLADSLIQVTEGKAEENAG